MTAQLEDLDTLIKAVEVGAEAGTIPFFTACGPFDGAEWGETAWCAYTGSLDAALRLHEALLPGWRVHDFCQYPDRWHIVLNGDTAPHFFHGEASTPARAWLLAVLRAYRATLETKT